MEGSWLLGRVYLDIVAALVIVIAAGPILARWTGRWTKGRAWVAPDSWSAFLIVFVALLGIQRIL